MFKDSLPSEIKYKGHTAGSNFSLIWSVKNNCLLSLLCSLYWPRLNATDCSAAAAATNIIIPIFLLKSQVWSLKNRLLAANTNSLLSRPITVLYCVRWGAVEQWEWVRWWRGEVGLQSDWYPAGCLSLPRWPGDQVYRQMFYQYGDLQVEEL